MSADSGIFLEKYNDLSSSLGTGVVEFHLAPNEDFNQRLGEITCSEEGMFHKGLDNYLTKNEYSASMESNPEWWNECSRIRKRKLLEEFDFLSLPYDELRQLKQSITYCVDQYLGIFEKEYRGKRPNYFHSWAVICKLEKKAESPHIHHFNPINLAGVYYVSGDFSPQNGELEIYPDNRRTQTKLTYCPNAGRILLFPAPLPHAIGYYNGRTPRISIAFDIWFKKEPKANSI